MLISHRHRFIFIHVSKTAGTSIERALAPFAEPVDREGIGKNLPLLGPLARLPIIRRFVKFGIHVSASQVRSCVGPGVWDDYLTFGIVRNPYDRLVSRYHYIVSRPEHRRHAKVVQLGGFAAYVRWEIGLNRRRIHQHSDLCDGAGRVLVKHVGKFEALDRDFSEVTRRLGIQAVLPHENKSSHRDYRAYYDDELRELVGRFCARDLELFGYDFDGPRAG